MATSQKMMYKVYAGLLGTAATLATSKLLEAGWKAATGNRPPDPNDPTTSLKQATIWALASGVGVGVVQLMVNRYTARRWFLETGGMPDPTKVNVKV